MPDDLADLYNARRSLLELSLKAIQDETNAALANVRHIDRISFRVKNTASFVKKACDRKTTPPYQDPLTEIEDQIAGRIIVFFLTDILIVLNRLQGTFTAIERKYMRPLKDHEFNYESHHLICILPPHLKPNGWSERTDLPSTFEIQVRTIFMHAYAEPQHDIGYKAASELPSEIRRELAWVAASAWGADQALKRVQEWDAARAADGQE